MNAHFSLKPADRGNYEASLIVPLPDTLAPFLHPSFWLFSTCHYTGRFALMTRPAMGISRRGLGNARERSGVVVVAAIYKRHGDVGTTRSLFLNRFGMAPIATTRPIFFRHVRLSLRLRPVSLTPNWFYYAREPGR